MEDFEDLDDFEVFSPAAQRYLATPTRFADAPGRPTQRTSLGTDFQTYEKIGETGSPWSGTTATYQVYDPFGTPTQTTQVAESGGIKDALQTAAQVFGPTLLSAGLGSLVSPYIGQAASAVSEAVGGGTLGNILGGAVTGAGQSALGSVFTGGNLEDALLSGALGGAASPLSSALIEPLGLPAPLTNIATKGLAAEILGKDAEKAIINAALGELFRSDPNEAALRAAYGPEGQASRVAEGEFRADQERAAFDDLLASLAPTSAPLPQTPTADLDTMIEDPYGPQPIGMNPVEREAFLEANIPDPLERLLARPAEEVDWASVYAQPSMAPAYTDPDGFYVHEEPLIGADPTTYPIQDIVPTPENMASYQTNLQDIYDNRGGFTSQWQTAGSDRIMIQDDGSAIGINTETGETYGLEADETKRLVDAGLLNTEASGYNEAIGATQPAAAPPPASAPAPAPAPSPAARGGVDLGALMALMGAMAGGQQQPRDEYKTADVRGAQSPFGSILDTDELLRVLRG